MNKLFESKNYIISHIYERVFLIFKNNNKSILIGEFYGDPTTAIISKNEDFCVVGGEGIIVYFINDPYIEYYKDKYSLTKWIEWGRENKKTVWIEKVEEIEDNIIQLSLENNRHIIMSVDCKTCKIKIIN